VWIVFGQKVSLGDCSEEVAKGNRSLKGGVGELDGIVATGGVFTPVSEDSTLIQLVRINITSFWPASPLTVDRMWWERTLKGMLSELMRVKSPSFQVVSSTMTFSCSC
jgi:hypothetical protein